MTPRRPYVADVLPDPVAYLVEAEPGRPLRTADGELVEALVFVDRADAERAVDIEIQEQDEDAAPLAIVPLVRRDEE